MAPNSNSVKVVLGPVKFDGAPWRVVELSDGSGRIETWRSGAWTMSEDASLADLMFAAPATDAFLAAAGVTASRDAT
jgi:hypothetical protein